MTSRRAVRFAVLIGFDACVTLVGLNAAIPRGVHAAEGLADSVLVARTPSGSGGLAGLTLAASAEDDLGPSTDPPWNPPRAIHARRDWERVLLFPGQVVSFPLELLADGFARGLLYVEQTSLLQKIGYVARVVPERTGVKLRLANLGDRTGLGAKVEARTTVFGGALRNLLSVSHSASMRHYHLTEVRLLGEPLGLEYEYGWRPQDRFYGLGMETSEDSVTSSAAQTEGVRLSLVKGWTDDETIGKKRTFIGFSVGPRTQITRRGRDPDSPSIEQRFPEVVAATLNRRFEHLVYGAYVTSDWRVGVPHWSGGWRALAQVDRFDEPMGAIALRSGRGGGAQFTRTTAELEAGTSFYRDPRTLRILGRLVDTGVTSGADRFMVEDMASLGGRSGLYGFEPGRFHDLDAVLLRLSWIFPLARRFEIDLHAESGGVFPDVWEGARIDRLEQSFGLALRGRTSTHPIGNIGADFSREGFRIRYSLGNPE